MKCVDSDAVGKGIMTEVFVWYGIKEEYFTDLLRDVFERWRDFKYEKKNS